MLPKVIRIIFSDFILGLFLFTTFIKHNENNQIIFQLKIISEVESNMEQDIKKQLSQALAPISRQYSLLVNDTMTDVEVYHTSFLNQYKIYRVKHFNPYKPVLFYVGFTPNKRAYLLTSNPENYFSLAKADNVAINSPELARDYATTYLEVTRSMSKLFYLVRSVGAVKFRPGLDSEETEVQKSFLSKYREVIAEPTVMFTDNQYTVTAFVVAEQTLSQYFITVNREGIITIRSQIIEQNLPLVYGL